MNSWKSEVSRRRGAVEAKVEVKKQESQLEVLSRLRKDIRRVETAGRVGDVSRISSGFPAIDRLLPEGGYLRGVLVQWLTNGGLGADYLSLVLAKQACQNGGALVVADPFNQFYPPAAAAIGINLDHLVVLRGRSLDQTDSQGQADFFWSIDQALRCSGVAAVWGPLGKVDERWFRRFQLSAETSGCLGIFVQPLEVLRQPSWAEVQWVVSDGGRRNTGKRDHRDGVEQSHISAKGNESVEAQPKKDFRIRQKLRLQLTRCRGTQTGKSIDLLIDAITGSVNRVQSIGKRCGSETSVFLEQAERSELPISSDSSSWTNEKLGSGTGA